MKFGFWQIVIAEENRYKIAFTTPFGHCEWNVMFFGLKNTFAEFQHIMNDIFNAYSMIIIFYIDDVSIFSNSLDQHFKHLNIFFNIVILYVESNLNNCFVSKIFNILSINCV